MEKRYKALRTISTIYKALGIIVLVLTLLITVGICGFSFVSGAAIDLFAQEYGSSANGTGFLSGAMIGIVSSLFSILWGGLISVTLYAVGEGLSLLISLEENTRKTAYLIENPKST